MGHRNFLLLSYSFCSKVLPIIITIVITATSDAIEFEIGQILSSVLCLRNDILSYDVHFISCILLILMTIFLCWIDSLILCVLYHLVYMIWYMISVLSVIGTRFQSFCLIITYYIVRNIHFTRCITLYLSSFLLIPLMICIDIYFDLLIDFDLSSCLWLTVPQVNFLCRSSSSNPIRCPDDFFRLSSPRRLFSQKL